MKKKIICIALLLSLAMLFIISGCGAKNVNISNFKEIEYKFALEKMEKHAKRFEDGRVSYLNGCSCGGNDIVLSGNQGVVLNYCYLEGIYVGSLLAQDEFSETEPALNYTREDGVDIRDVEGMHNEFEEQYILFEEFCSDNPDSIQMEMQDDRGYIIFDIDDSEIISALSGEDEVSEGTRYYGVRYHCDRCYITATYMSDSNDDFRDFVSLLDELGLPHM